MTNPLTSSTALDDAATRPALTANDTERIATAIDAELAPSTRQVYTGAWRQWERWCQGRGIVALPAPSEALAAFLTERAEAGLTFGTLDGYCSGIAHRHQQEGFADPTADVVVRRVRRGLRRVMGVAPRRQAHPLTPAEIAQIISAIDTSTPIGVRDRAVVRHGHVTTDRIGPRAISRLVQTRASAAGLDGIPITGHSLRASHTTTAAINGAPIDRIAAQTRHCDRGTLLNHYIRPAEALATSTSRDLGL